MMNRFEENIRKNRQLFDDAEPEPGHFDRFAEKLDRAEARQNKRNVFRISYLWRMAAALVILITISVLYTQIENLNLLKTGQSQELPAELVQATYYYQNLNQEKINEIGELSTSVAGNEEIVEIAKQEAEAIGQDAENLKKKYLETRDDRIIDAIITNYRVLGELLDHIIQQVK